MSVVVRDHEVAPFIVLALFGASVGVYFASCSLGLIAYLAATVWREGS